MTTIMDGRHGIGFFLCLKETSNNMEIGTISQLLKEVIVRPPRDRENYGEFQGAVLTTFSLHPPRLVEILNDVANDLGIRNRQQREKFLQKFHVLFQRYSFNQPGGVVRDKKRDDLIRKFRAESDFSMLRMKTFKGMNNPTQTNKQMHLKGAVFVFSGKVVYIQYSNNLDRRHQDAQELIYKGIPQDLDKWITMTRDILRTPNLVEDVKSPRERKWRQKAIRFLQRALPLYAQMIPDEYTWIVCQDENTSIGDNFKAILRNVNARDFAYHQWRSDAQHASKESILLLHFPFVNESYASNLCDAVVGPLSNSEWELKKTFVELTYSQDPALHDIHFPHESWICRLKGRDNRNQLLWMFMVTSNLTIPSWGTRARNYECGVVTFEKERGSNFTDPFREHIFNSLKDSDNTMQRTANCGGVLKSDLVQTAAPVDNNILQGGENCSPEILHCDDIARDPNLSTWQRFVKTYKCLVRGVLPGLVGTSNILDSDLLRYNYYMRFALYHYIFVKLAKDHPAVPLGGYNEQLAKKVFTKTVIDPAPHSWWTECGNARTTMNVLVDIFVRWSNAFDMFDPRINIRRPSVSQDTILSIHDARAKEQIVENPNHKFRTKQIDRIDRPDEEKVTVADSSPYDTLSFLMQSMFSKSAVWWKCSRNHTFYENVRLIMTQNPTCRVCALYHDIQHLYEIIQQKYGDRINQLTVEFPLVRKVKAPKNKKKSAEDKERDKNRDMMRYDLFFLLDKDKVCAIEFDDSSHNTASKSVEDIDLDNPTADAAKNIISCVFGINLLRIWTGQTRQHLNRSNAKARMELILDRFIQAVRDNGVNSAIPTETNRTFFQTQKRAFLQGPPQARRAERGIWKPSQLHLIPNATKPVFRIFATDVPDREFRESTDAFVERMMMAGKKHPSWRKAVNVDKQIDERSMQAYYQMIVEWKKITERKGDADGYILKDRSYKGRLMDKFDNAYNGLAMVSVDLLRDQQRGPQDIDAYHVESDAILPWKTIQRQTPDNYTRIKTTVKDIGKSFIRLRDPMIPRPPIQRNPFRFPEEGPEQRWGGTEKSMVRYMRVAQGDEEELEVPQVQDNPVVNNKYKRFLPGSQWAYEGKTVKFRRRTANGALRGYEEAVVTYVKETAAPSGGGADVLYMYVQRDEEDEEDVIAEQDFKYVFSIEDEGNEAPLSNFIQMKAAVDERQIRLENRRLAAVAGRGAAAGRGATAGRGAATSSGRGEGALRTPSNTSRGSGGGGGRGTQSGGGGGGGGRARPIAQAGGGGGGPGNPPPAIMRRDMRRDLDAEDDYN